MNLEITAPENPHHLRLISVAAAGDSTSTSPVFPENQETENRPKFENKKGNQLKHTLRPPVLEESTQMHL